MYPKPVFLPAGDQCLVMEVGDDISPETNRRVRDLFVAADRAALPGVLDLVPSYRSLLVQFDPAHTSAGHVRSALEALLADLGEEVVGRARVVGVPVLYGGEGGSDIAFVAEHNGLTVDEVITLHSGTTYRVYMMGFSPGFPYLGGLPTNLATPRLPTPRVEVPAGSVGIAESQTGVYPTAGPGGWRLIGRTPLRFFDPLKEPPALLNAGDYVRFVPMADAGEYARIAAMVAKGEYVAATEPVP